MAGVAKSLKGVVVELVVRGADLLPGDRTKHGVVVNVDHGSAYGGMVNVEVLTDRGTSIVGFVSDGRHGISRSVVIIPPSAA